MFLQASAQALTVILKTNLINDIIYHFHTLATWGSPQSSSLYWKKKTENVRFFIHRLIFSPLLSILWAITQITWGLPGELSCPMFCMYLCQIPCLPARMWLKPDQSLTCIWTGYMTSREIWSCFLGLTKAEHCYHRDIAAFKMLQQCWKYNTDEIKTI